MPNSPNDPFHPNPYDLEGYDVNIVDILCTLGKREFCLCQITEFRTGYEKSFHDGMLAELRSIIRMIKSNLYGDRCKPIVNISAMLDLLSYRNVELRKTRIFPSEFDKALHDGELAEIRNVSELIKENLKKENGDPLP